MIRTLLCGLALAACTPYAAAQDAARDERWRRDLAFLSERLEAVHPNAFANIGRDEFRRAVADLDSRIPSVADHQVVAGLAAVTALLGDGHTSLGLLQAGTGFRLYPIRLYWFSDGLFAVQAAQPYVRALGARVVRINDTPIEEAHRRVARFISHENESWLRANTPSYLVSPEALHAAGILAAPGPAVYHFESAAGQFSIEASPAAAGAFFAWPHNPRPLNPLYQRNGSLNYWYAWLEDSRTLYFKYNQCAGSPVLPFAGFARQLVSFIEANPVERFVFDLRSNTGGDSGVILPLYEGLARLIDRGAFAPSKGIFVITGRLTFSSGLMAAMDVKGQGGGITVGEPTGGKPSHFGNVSSFALPNSRLAVSHSTRYFEREPWLTELSLPVDIPVEFTAADYAAERDPFLEAAITASASPRPAAPAPLWLIPRTPQSPR